MLISPRIIHSHTELPILIFRTNNRNSLLGCSIITISLNTRIYNYILIIRSQQINDTFRVPSFCCLFPVSIKPIQIRLPGFIQFTQLCHIEIYKTLPPYRIIFITNLCTCHIWIIRMRPVQQ